MADLPIPPLPHPRFPESLSPALRRFCPGTPDPLALYRVTPHLRWEFRHPDRWGYLYPENRTLLLYVPDYGWLTFGTVCWHRDPEVVPPAEVDPQEPDPWSPLPG